MLAQILAIAVALGSAVLFLTAFIFPKLHRQDDFFWSTVGLFYALILWVCAGQMAGAVLLGQLASVILLGWLAWETLRLRQAIADPSKIPDLNKVSLVGYVKDRFKKPKLAPTSDPKTQQKSTSDSPNTTAPETEKPKDTTLSESSETAPVAPPEKEEPTPEPTMPSPPKDPDATDSPDPAPSPETAEAETPAAEPNTTAPETENDTITAPSITAQPPKQGFSFSRLFGRKPAAPTASTESTTPTEEANIEQIFAAEDTPEANTASTDAPDETAPAEMPTTESPETANQAETEVSEELDELPQAEEPPKD